MPLKASRMGRAVSLLWVSKIVFRSSQSKAVLPVDFSRKTCSLTRLRNFTGRNGLIEKRNSLRVFIIFQSLAVFLRYRASYL